MEYEGVRVPELKALARERGLRGYSRMRRAELITLLQNNPPPAPRTRPPRPTRPPPPPQPRDPNQQEMDIFEQREMSESRPQVGSELNKWYDWLVNHVPKPIRDSASKAFKTFKDKVMGLYDRVTTPVLELTHDDEAQEQPTTQSGGEEPFTPIELEQAFRGAYVSYRINGRPRMDADTFFNRVRRELIELIRRELRTRTSARIQTTAWIRFVRDNEEQGAVEMGFNSLMTSVYRGSDLDEIVDGLIAHMRTQMEHPALLNSRFVFDEFLRLDIRFHQLNLTRGSSYLPLPNWIAKKKAIINPKNMNDGLCFKWAVIAADKWMDIDYNPERISSLIRFRVIMIGLE